MVRIGAQPSPGALLLFAFEFARPVERDLQRGRVGNVEPDACDQNILAVCVRQVWNRGSSRQLIQASWKNGAISLKNSVSLESGYSSL
jgi:hypothetical protein